MQIKRNNPNKEGKLHHWTTTDPPQVVNAQQHGSPIILLRTDKEIMGKPFPSDIITEFLLNLVDLIT